MAAFSVLSSATEHGAAMQLIARRTLLVGLLASTVLAFGTARDGAWADKIKQRAREGDHDDAFSAREDGTILPLAEVLAIIRPRIDGEIIETEFEYEGGRPVYEFKYVDRRGRVRELYVDARTGRILKDEPD